MDKSTRADNRWAVVVEAVLIAALYAGAARLGFLLAVPPGNVSAFWPPSGIAFAAVILCGFRALPAIWLGSFLVNSWFFLTHFPDSLAAGLPTAIIVSLGSTAQAACGGYLLRKLIGSRSAIGNPLDAFRFFGIAAVICVVGATIGVYALVLFGFIPWEMFFKTWMTWWAGDLGGVLVFTTFALTWRQIPEYMKDSRRVAELVASLFILILVSEALAWGDWSRLARMHYPFTFFLFPFIIWGAGRFGASAVTLYVLVIEIIAVLGTKNGLGPFVRPTLSESLLLLQLFISGGALCSIAVASLVSEWQDSKQKLEQFAQDLEGKISERTEELKEANRELVVTRDRAVEASNFKSAFVANISHELRTPLSGIIGVAQMLNSAYAKGSEKELLQILQESANSLLKIVNEILDLSKLEAGKVAIENEPFNPIYLVQDIARTMALAATAKGLVLRTHVDHRIPELVRGDANRVRQALRNFLGNAMKFTEHGEVSLEVALESEDEKHVTVRFNVGDTGIGISESDQKQLFQPFAQVEGQPGAFGGTGLGLSICKELVELMDGKIGVESERGKGSLFWFTLPFDRCVARAEVGDVDEIIAADKKIWAGKSMLVVEDDPIIRSLLEKQLSAIGVNAQIVANGREAIDAVAKKQYDLILMDCQMPVMDGFEATKLIREAESARGAHTPIVALTANAMTGDELKCRAAGMDDFLVKPVSLNDLVSVFIRWLGRTGVEGR